MSALNELINISTELIQNGGFLIGFFIILLEAFIPLLPLGAFITLNVKAFNIIPGILLSWSATVIGSYLMYLICTYISNKIIYKIIKEKTKEKILSATSTFSKIKLQHLVLIITLPFTPSCFINVLAAITNIEKEKYLISLIIGKAFMVTFWAYIGMSLIESLTNIKAIIFIVLILVIAYFISKYISKKFKIE